MLSNIDSGIYYNNLFSITLELNNFTKKYTDPTIDNYNHNIKRVFATMSKNSATMMNP